MKVTFTDIRWRNHEDSQYFNLHAIKSITLDGTEKGTITIDCIAGVFKSLYCNLSFGGGVPHYDLVTNYGDDFISLAIFENKVCIAPAAYVPEWFKKECKFFCC